MRTVMKAIYRWRKTSDIHRENALFELVEGEKTILDLGFSNEGLLEIAFCSSIDGKVFDFRGFLETLENGKILAELDL